MTPVRQEQPVDPAHLRMVFGSNLRTLAARYSSVASLCRELGINRTQFNRYLGGESFPRPDVLHRICIFFDVDARILLEPVETLVKQNDNLFKHPAVSEFLNNADAKITEQDLPSGFYRYSRQSFVASDQFVIGCNYVFRANGHTFIRGYEPRSGMPIQGLGSSLQAREYRGVIMRQEQGLTIMASRRGAISCSYSFISRLGTINNSYWEGYSTRTTTESLSEARVARLVFEHLPNGLRDALPVARKAGFVSREALPPYHLRLLRPDEPFR